MSERGRWSGESGAPSLQPSPASRNSCHAATTAPYITDGRAAASVVSLFVVDTGRLSGFHGLSLHCSVTVRAISLSNDSAEIDSVIVTNNTLGIISSVPRARLLH